MSKVDFYASNTFLGTDTSSPYSFPWTNVGQGNYTLIAKATDNAGNTSLSNAVSVAVNPPPPIPSAPTSLTAIAVSKSQINLAWTDNSTVETGFKIERSTNNVNFTQIATVLTLANQASRGNSPRTDLAITCSASPDPVKPNNDLTYTLKVSNNSSQPASGVVTNTKLSPYVDFVSGSVSQGSCRGAYDTVVCNIGTLNALDSATITIVVKTRADGLQVRAQGMEISSTTLLGTDLFDTNLANNKVQAITKLLPDIQVAPR